MDGAARETRIQTACLIVLSGVALGFALYWLRPVMIPFVMALFFVYGLQPVVDVQMRHFHLPRALAVLSTLLLGGLIFFLLGGIITASVSQLAANAALYQAKLGELVEGVLDWLPLQHIGQSADDVIERFKQVSVGAVGGMVVSTTNAILEVLSRSLLVLVFVVFLLIGRGGARTEGTGGEIESRIRRYIVTKAVLSAATGVLTGTILALLGVDLAMAFGLFAFLLNFIPSIGSLIATLLPLPVVIVSPDATVTLVILAIGLPGGVQFTIGNIIEPKVMGESMDLHPVAIVMALIFWGMLWGVVGMLLAVPMTAVMRILFEKLDQTRPLANLLAGRI